MLHTWCSTQTLYTFSERTLLPFFYTLPFSYMLVNGELKIHTIIIKFEKFIDFPWVLQYNPLSQVTLLSLGIASGGSGCERLFNFYSTAKHSVHILPCPFLTVMLLCRAFFYAKKITIRLLIKDVKPTNNTWNKCHLSRKKCIKKMEVSIMIKTVGQKVVVNTKDCKVIVEVVNDSEIRVTKKEKRGRKRRRGKELSII